MLEEIGEKVWSYTKNNAWAFVLAGGLTLLGYPLTTPEFWYIAVPTSILVAMID